MQTSSRRRLTGPQDGVTIGAGSVQNSFNIDGASAQSSAYGGQRSGDYVPFTFSQAAIKEFQVIRSAYNLEYSAGGAVVNAITRSGSNQLHGEVFGYYRDENLVGADAEGNEADTFTQLQFGFALGGPLVRDRLHYFISYDEQDLEEPTFREFVGFPAGREQDWEDLTGLDWDRETGLLMGLNDARVMLLKLDWQVGSTSLLTARSNMLSVPSNRNLVNGWPISGWSSDGQVLNDSDSVVFSLNSVASPRIVNEVFVQYATDQRTALPNSSLIPEVGIGGSGDLGWDGGFGQWTYLPGYFSESRWQFVDNLSYSLGQHTIRGGFNFDFVKFEDLFFKYSEGQYRFDFWDEFLDGEMPYKYTQAFSPIDGRVEYGVNTFAVYLQDSWQTTPSLSLVYGLRYDYQDHDQPKTTNPLYPLTGQIPNDSDNVSARFGAAWDPNGDGKAALRGGIGLFYDASPTILDAKAHSTNGINIVQVTSWCRWGDPCPTFPDRWESIADLSPDEGPDIFVFDPTFENPQTLRMSLGYEREIAPNTSIGIDLVYSRSRNLPTKQDQNLAPSGELTVDGRTVYERGTVERDFGKIIMFRSDGEATSTSFVLFAKRRFSNGWFVDGSYTWSQIRDNGPHQRSLFRAYGFPEDQYDIEAEWGPANYDVRHKFVVSGGVDLPHGFLISGYVFVRSGYPYSAGHGWDLNGDGYWDRSVIETEPGFFYHYPRNTFRQPWFSTVNLRLAKTFQLGRQVNLEFIGEVFNLLDSANWWTTNWTLSWGCDHNYRDVWVPCQVNEAFGDNNISGRPRQYQLGLNACPTSRFRAVLWGRHMAAGTAAPQTFQKRLAGQPWHAGRVPRNRFRPFCGAAVPAAMRLMN